MTRKHLVKKCTAGLLVSCLLCGSLPMTAMAQETVLDKAIESIDSTIKSTANSLYDYVVARGTEALDKIEVYVTQKLLDAQAAAQAAFKAKVQEWKAELIAEAEEYGLVSKEYSAKVDAVCDEIIAELEALAAEYGDDVQAFMNDVDYAVAYWMSEADSEHPNKDDDNVIEYVSIGDSMSNGYCFDGYAQGEEGVIDFFNGVNVYGEAAYPNQFAEWLDKEENFPGYEVKHTKLAPSAMRAEDLNYLLGGREEPTDDWQNQVNGYTEVDDDEALSNFFQTEVKNADVITLAIGNASFGAYMLHRVTDALGVLGGTLDEDEKVDLNDALYDLDEEQKQIVLKIYDHLIEKFKEYVPAETAAKFNLDEVTDLIAYTAAGFVVNYKGALEQIVELNPKADIVLLGLLNTTYGMVVTDDEIADIPVGDIMDTVFEVLNAYVAGLPAAMQTAGMWSENDFYYAEQPEPKFISQQFAEMKADGWQVLTGVNEGLSGEIVRDRTIESYNDSLRPVIGGAFGYNLPEITLADVKTFESNTAFADETPFQNPVTNEWTTLGWAAAAQAFGQEKAISIAIYLGIEDAVAASCDTMEIPLEGLVTIATDITGVFAGLNVDKTTPVSIRTSLGGYLTSTETLKGMCKIFALFKIGNGMSVHPTPEGHAEIATAVIEAYKNGYTAKDSIVDKVTELGALIAEYAPEYLEKLYNYAEEEGYIDELKAEALRIKGEVCTYVKEDVIPELENQKAILEEKLDELEAELKKLEEELKNAAEEAKAAIEAEIAKVKAMIEDVKAALEELNAAINDLVEYVNDVIEAVDNLIEALQNVNEDLMGYVDAVQDALTKLGEAIGYIEGVIADINDAINEAQEAFVEAVEELLALNEKVQAALKEAAETAAVVIAEVKEIAAKIPGAVAEAKAFVEKAAADIKYALETSFANVYTLKEDSYYVAIGDESVEAVEGQNYAELVAAQIFKNTEDVNAKYAVKAMEDGKRAEDLVAFVNTADVAAEIKKADLVTIGLSHNEILEYVVDQVWNKMYPFGGSVTEADWAKYVGEEGAAEIAKAVAELHEYIAEREEENADLLTFVIEQYAYASVSYAMCYAEAINAIHALSPDALVVIVGMYNAFEDIELLGVELGQYIDAAVKAMNVYGAVYALLTENTIYVDAPAVEILGMTATDVITEFVRNDAEGFRANEAGHEYIKDQILGKVEQAYQLGDVNMDGYIKAVDAAMAYAIANGRYNATAVQYTLADVNGDGEIKAVDAAMIYAYANGRLAKFPAEQ